MTSSPMARPRALLWLVPGLLVLAALALLLLRQQPPGAGEKAASQRFTQGGLSVELSVESAEPSRRGQPLRVGDIALFRFTFTDAATGAPLTRLFPVAWMDARSADEPTGEQACRERVKRLLDSSIFGRDAVDLNIYQVLVLNADATVSVVDPRFGFGGSRLLTKVFLRSPGVDWALLDDQSTLFVSMPDSGRVAVVDTRTYQVVTELEAGPAPGRLALQPDGGYLWIVHGEGGEESGVTVVEVATRAVVRRLKLGQGPHELAFSSDSRTAFITHQQGGTVSVVDVARLEVVAELPAGKAPVHVAFSRSAQAAYVVDRAGALTVVDGASRQVRAQLPLPAGVERLWFEPTGRHGFALAPEQDMLHVLDAASNQIVQSGRMEKGPDQIVFSDTLAYVRHRGSEVVLMVPLDQVGTPGQPLPVVDFPGGQVAPGPAGLAPTLARAPGSNAMLVVNTRDEAIYFYKEGMAAPMGHFKSYGPSPRAVRVLDRSLRERSPGVYEATAQLKHAGPQVVALLLDSPRLTHCFSAEVAPAPDTPKPPTAPVLIELVQEQPALEVGRPVRLRVRLRDPTTRQPRDGVTGLSALVYLASGTWQERQVLTAEGGGVYALDFTPPEEGAYILVLEAPSIGLSLKMSQQIILTVEAPAPQEGTR
jgi:hypothetical protein